MELPVHLKGLGEKISKLRGSKVTVETPQDPHYIAAVEAISKRTLIDLYTKPEIVQNLGTMGRARADFNKSGQEVTKMETEFGINSNAVPHLTSNLNAAQAQAADIITLTRESALSRVSFDRRGTVEKEALLEAQRRLTEKLKEEGLSRDYRTGASEMLRRIEDRLKEKPALSEEKTT